MGRARIELASALGRAGTGVLESAARGACYMERETIRKIRDAVRTGGLPHQFTPTDVNKALSIHWAGTFLSTHRIGNPGKHSGLFVRVKSGVYRLLAK